VGIKSIVSGFSAVLVVLLAGCGGSSSNDDGTNNSGGGIVYSGSTAPAAVSGSNAENLGVGTTDAISQAIDSDSADISGIPFSVSIIESSDIGQQILAKSLELVATQQFGNLPVGVTIGGEGFSMEQGYCGGSMTIPDSWASDEGLSGDSAFEISGTITFNNLCLDLGSAGFGAMTINGAITISAGGVRTYNNLTARFADGTSIICDGVDCSASAVFSGADGATYSVADVVVTGDSIMGYSVDASYCHGTYGCLTISTDSPIIFSCENGRLASGSISFSSTDGSSGTITFNDCNSYTIAFATITDGSIVTVMGTW